MLDREPIPLKLIGDAAAIVEAEAIIEDCTPGELVAKAVALYCVVAPDLRNGGQLFIEIDETNDTIDNRRGLGKLVTKFANMLGGHPGRTLSRRPIILKPVEAPGD